MIYEIDNSVADIDWKAKGKDRIIQNIRNILRLYQGEVPYDRGLGLNPDLEDVKLDELQKKILTEAKEMLSDYEVDVIDTRLQRTAEGIKITLVVDIDEVY